eukprot:TRINITY_DN633_c0_g2_i1.p1 TRINITY_DN633_c0_g2~~TRINITY_DN633_c0_g2_i1.p1  ORF type:complete len:175 (+),score=55.27 TRINITY_DN633_c0_g2_i1:60-527(+)
MAEAIASMLTKLAEANDEKYADSEPSYYDAMEVPQVTVLDMLKRWARYSYSPNEVLVLAAVYVDRAVEEGVRVTSLSVHRVLLSALVVATKYHCDQVYNNMHYAKVGGVSPKELNRLETAFITDLQWTLHVDPETFNATCRSLSRAAKKLRRRSL